MNSVNSRVVYCMWRDSYGNTISKVEKSVWDQAGAITNIYLTVNQIKRIIRQDSSK